MAALGSISFDEARAFSCLHAQAGLAGQSLMPQAVSTLQRQSIEIIANSEKIAGAVATKGWNSLAKANALVGVEPAEHIQDPAVRHISDVVHSTAFAALSGVAPIISGVIGLKECGDELQDLSNRLGISENKKAARLDFLAAQKTTLQNQLLQYELDESLEPEAIELEILKIDNEISDLTSAHRARRIAMQTGTCILKILANLTMILSGMATLAGLFVTKLWDVLEKLGPILQTVFKALASWGPIVGAVTTGILIITDTIDLIKLLVAAKPLKLIEKIMNGDKLTVEEQQTIRLIKEKLLSLLANMCMFTAYVLTIIITTAGAAAAAMNPEVVFAVILVLSIISVICHLIEKWDTIKDFAFNYKGASMFLLLFAFVGLCIFVESLI